MYLVTSKKDKTKFVHLVNSECPTTTDSLVKMEVNDENLKISNIKDIKFDNIFKGEGEYFYSIQIEYSSEVDDKVLKDFYLQQASNYDNAINSINRNIKFGEIIEVKRTNISSLINFI